MNPSSEAPSPLRQRMIDDMRMRKLELKTRTAYLRAVTKLATFLKRSPDTATVEDLRRFQLYLVDHGTSPITINATICGLKFFFGVTPGRSELMSKMRTVQVPQRLPVVLSRDEVARLIAAAPNLKSHTALSLAYATGLRVSEVVALKVTDIDSKRMTLRVEQGKGRKDRYASHSIGRPTPARRGSRCRTIYLDDNASLANMGCDRAVGLEAERYERGRAMAGRTRPCMLRTRFRRASHRVRPARCSGRR
jgi:integrase